MDDPAPLVTVIIVYWNGASVIDRCLNSLFAQTFQDFEVLVVDNGSTENTLTDVNLRWPRVKLIRLDKNQGFAAANNIAARSARGQWLALLNSDAFPEPGWLEALLDASHKHPDLFFFTSCQIQANNPDKLDGTGDLYHIGGIAWRRQSNEPVEQAIQVIDEVFSACGAAAFYPRDVFLQAGGFDEDFFSYLEDVDLSFRLRLLGYRCLYVPQAKVLHVGSASLGKESEFAIYYSQRNMLWIFLKNMPSPYFWKYLPLHLVMNMGFSLYYSLCCCPCASLRAAKDTMLGIPSALRKRKEIQSIINVDIQELKRVIRFPGQKNRNPLGIILLIPKLLIRFIVAVRKCRMQRHGSGRISQPIDISLHV
jgi:GT2 family glycosyltransferase